MKKIFSVSAAIIAMSLICTVASAQSFRTGYFLDNYIYSYRINPAIVSDDSFFGLAVTNIDLQNSSNIGISSILYPSGNSIVTGLNSKVSADEFLGKLSQNNGLNLDESINILSMGFAKKDHYSTVEVNVRAMAGASLPYDLLAFLKKGGIGKTYDISNIYANAKAYADVSYGYARDINDKISVGGRVHFLVGLANVTARSQNTSISMSEQEMAVTSDMNITSAGLLELSTTSDGAIDASNTKFGMDNGMGGFGASIDLGAVYKPIDGLEVSLAVNDLGAISWSNNFTGKASGRSTVSGGTIKLNDGKLETDLENALTALTECVNVKNTGKSSSFEMLPATIAAGARYTMPFYEGLSAGMLATIHTGTCSSWYDLRAGATITPARIVSAAANLGISSFGPTFGAALNLHLGPVNLVAGTDCFMSSMTKISNIPVPVPLNKFVLNAHLGLSISF